MKKYSWMMAMILGCVLLFAGCGESESASNVKDRTSKKEASEDKKPGKKINIFEGRETPSEEVAEDSTDSIADHRAITDITEEDWRELERICVSTYNIPYPFDYQTTSPLNIISGIWMGDYRLYCQDAYAYYYDYDDPNAPSDPRDRVNKTWESYCKLDADACDWIVQNVYHIAPDRLMESEWVYYEDGFYYICMSGVGGEATVATIMDTKKLDQEKYYVMIVEREAYAPEYYQYKYLIVDLELIDGKRIWTFYQTEVKPFEDIPIKAEIIYADFLRSYQKSDMYSNKESVFYLADLDNDTISELLVIDDDSHVAGVNIYSCRNGSVEQQGVVGGYGYAYVDCEEGILFSIDGHMGCEFTNVYAFRDGRLIQEHELYADNLDVIDVESNYMIDGISVTEEQYEKSKNEIWNKCDTATVVRYENGSAINSENISLLYTQPERFMIH